VKKSIKVELARLLLQISTNAVTVTEVVSTSVSIHRARTNASATRDTRCDPTVAPVNQVRRSIICILYWCFSELVAADRSDESW